MAAVPQGRETSKQQLDRPNLIWKRMEGNGRILNVPHYLNNPRPSTEAEESDQDQMETESHTESTTEEQGDEGIGEFDDGKNWKADIVNSARGGPDSPGRESAFN